MPTYTYKCQNCGEEKTVLLFAGEEEPKTCEKCGGELKKVIKGVNVSGETTVGSSCTVCNTGSSCSCTTCGL